MIPHKESLRRKMIITRRCKACGEQLPDHSGRGRKSDYCPPPKGCKYRAYRERKEFRGETVPRNKPHLDLIYCAGDNERLTRMAYEAGLLIGIRSGRSAHNFPVSFVDIEYKRPNFEKHLKAIARYQPKYATVLDLSDTEVSKQDIARAMMQYEQVLLCSSRTIPLIVPKLYGQVALLPDHVAIGYSIPTSYGGAKDVKLWELEGRRIHLLGGSPQKQIEIYRTLSVEASIMSVDGNMAQLMATQFAKYWDGDWVEHPQRNTNTPDLYLDCWRRSCENIRRAWGKIVDLQPGQLTLVS